MFTTPCLRLPPPCRTHLCLRYVDEISRLHQFAAVPYRRASVSVHLPWDHSVGTEEALPILSHYLVHVGASASRYRAHGCTTLPASRNAGFQVDRVLRAVRLMSWRARDCATVRHCRCRCPQHCPSILSSWCAINSCGYSQVPVCMQRWNLGSDSPTHYRLESMAQS